MTRHHRTHHVMIAVASAAAIAALVANRGGLEGVAWEFETHVPTLLWLAMIAFAALSPVPLPNGRGHFRFTTALDLGAVLVLGPAFALWVCGLARVPACFMRRPVVVSDSLIDFSRSILAVAAAGFVVTARGWAEGPGSYVGTRDILTVLAAGAAYVTVGLVMDLLFLASRPRHASLGRLVARLGMEVPGDLLLLSFGLLLALTQIRIGTLAVALFLIPLLLARYLHRLWREAEHGHLAAVRNLMSAVDAVDPFSRGHSLRISRMCIQVAESMGLSKREVTTIEYAALLHDLGRVAIRREVLLKPGRLTEDEQMSLRSHPRIGHDMLREMRFFSEAAEAVLCHHEQPDGNGYPRKISGEAIPIGSRIIMAVAAFDAMTSDRPYRRGLAPEAAFEELLAKSGSQFDSEVVETLLDLYATNRLFAKVSERELLELVAEGCNSRALAAYMKGSGREVEAPVRGTPWWAEKPGNIVPILDLPEDEIVETTVRSSQEFTVREGDEAWTLSYAGYSDVGCSRDNNEDAFGSFDNDRGCLLLLADGMGGAAAGEVASRLAVDTVSRRFFENQKSMEAPAALRKAIETANDAILRRSEKDGKLEGMGTTCTALVCQGRRLFVGHVGDSRAYLAQGGSFRLLTEDHTLAAELSKAVAGNEGVMRDAHHVLTRCLGNEKEFEVDVVEPGELTQGSSVVLCTDGLTNMVNDSEMAEIVREKTPEAACQALIDLARKRGGPDNITVIVARLEAA